MKWVQEGTGRRRDRPHIAGRFGRYGNIRTSTKRVKNTWICLAHLRRLRANASNVLRYGSHSVTCKQHHICIYSQSQSITALWPVLSVLTREGMARLSWPGWLVRLINCPHRELNPDTVTHPSTNRARRRVTSLIWPTSLPTAPNRHQSLTITDGAISSHIVTHGTTDIDIIC